MKQTHKTTLTDKLFVIMLFIGIAISQNSCVVSNNLYVNDPNPVGRNYVRSYAGIGTGLSPLSDSVGSIKSGSTSMMIFPILSCGMQAGITTKTDFRMAFHIPVSFGGIGMRLGVQQSLFSNGTKFNMALGADLGGVLSSNEFSIGSVTFSSGNTKTKLAYNTDFFIPFSYTFPNESRIVLTPRYSLQVYKLATRAQFKVNVLTLGFYTRSIYLECSTVLLGDRYYPQFGFAWMFNED